MAELFNSAGQPIRILSGVSETRLFDEYGRPIVVLNWDGRMNSPKINEDVALTAKSTDLNLAASKSSYPINRLAGVLATQSGWDTAPTNLVYATDGDWTTTTGLGINTNVANNACGAGYFQFDMGAVYTIMVRGLITFSTPASGMLLIVMQSSIDGSIWITADNWQNSPQNAALWMGNNTLDTFLAEVAVHARYLRFYLKNSTGGAADIKIAIKEIQAIDLGV